MDRSKRSWLATPKEILERGDERGERGEGERERREWMRGRKGAPEEAADHVAERVEEEVDQLPGESRTWAPRIDSWPLPMGGPLSFVLCRQVSKISWTVECVTS